MRAPQVRERGAGDGWGSARADALARARARRRLTVVVGMLASACAGDTGTPPPAGPTAADAAELLKSAGDRQAWYFNNPLPDPYRVVARDLDGLPVAGVPVVWTVTSGGGSVQPERVETDAEGVASASHTLGPTEPAQSVEATADNLAAVVFTANGAAPATSVAVTVGNDFFQPRDVVVQVGGSVTWAWDPGGSFHNVTYTGGPTPRPADSPTQDSGMHGSTYAIVGRYDYVCTIHAGMEGSATVVR